MLFTGLPETAELLYPLLADKAEVEVIIDPIYDDDLTFKEKNSGPAKKRIRIAPEVLQWLCQQAKNAAVKQVLQRAALDARVAQGNQLQAARCIAVAELPADERKPPVPAKLPTSKSPALLLHEVDELLSQPPAP